MPAPIFIIIEPAPVGLVGKVHGPDMANQFPVGEEAEEKSFHRFAPNRFLIFLARLRGAHGSSNFRQFRGGGSQAGGRFFVSRAILEKKCF